MKSITTSQFWKLYYALPEDIQHRADRAYELWRLNPQAHGLYFKRVGKQNRFTLSVLVRVIARWGCLRVTLLCGFGLGLMMSMSVY